MDDIIPQKFCSKCKQPYPATKEYFQCDKNRSDGLYPQCKQCRSRKKSPEIPEGYRKCKECNEIFPATRDFFQSGPSFKCGLDNRCIPCRRAIDRAHNEEHREEVRAYNKAFYARNIEKSRAQKRANYYAHRDQVMEYRSRPEVKERKKLWSKHYFALSYVMEKQRKSNKKYYSTHKEQTVARKHKRLAIAKSVQGSYTPRQIREQLKRQKYRCYYAACGHAKFERVKGKYIYHIEHTFPLNRVAGTNLPANDISYLVLACPTCNLKKGAKYPWEWPEGGRLL